MPPPDEGLERVVTHEPRPEDAEVVDGLPVLAPRPAAAAERPAAARALALGPARQAAALGAAGFVAGAATAALVQRRRARAHGRRLRRKRARTPLGEVVASNSFLVDVHLLRRD